MQPVLVELRFSLSKDLVPSQDETCVKFFVSRNPAHRSFSFQYTKWYGRNVLRERRRERSEEMETGIRPGFLLSFSIRTLMRSGVWLEEEEEGLKKCREVRMISCDQS